MTNHVDAEMATIVKEFLETSKSALHRKALEYILQLEQQQTPLVEEVVQARLRAGKHCDHGAEPYYLIQRGSGTCLHCRRPLWALRPSDKRGQLPRFYICFDCKWIDQHECGDVKVAHDPPHD